MYSFQTLVNVPANRQVTITLPTTVPVGPVEVQLSVAWPPPDQDAIDGGPTADPKFNREWFAFYDLLPELLHTLRGQYVAIHDGQVVASGADKNAVCQNSRERFGRVTILVRLVSERPETRKIGKTWYIRNVEPQG